VAGWKAPLSVLKRTETVFNGTGKMGSGMTAAPRLRGQKFHGLFSFRGRFLVLVQPSYRKDIY